MVQKIKILQMHISYSEKSDMLYAVALPLLLCGCKMSNFFQIEAGRSVMIQYIFVLVETMTRHDTTAGDRYRSHQLRLEWCVLYPGSRGHHTRPDAAHRKDHRPRDHQRGMLHGGLCLYSFTRRSSTSIRYEGRDNGVFMIARISIIPNSTTGALEVL